MSANAHLVLVVDDDMAILEVIEARLDAAGYAVKTASSAEQALEALAGYPVDLVISDVKMPGMGGEGLLREVLEKWPEVPVILLTAFGNIPDAVSSIRTGAADYLTKPFDGHELLARVKDILSSRPPRGKKTAKRGVSPISEIIWGGTGKAMRDFYDLLERVAGSDVNVLVMGESGTGKEMVARVVHDMSRRSDGPLVIVDCGSTPATLLESELFGHVKGSFTHALRDKKGLITEADGGTLFLDEIGNISPEMQTRLLRFLQERTIRRIGDNKEIPVDCRVIAATNADLSELVRKGQFREDLYFRLKVVTVRVPPLRERGDDVELLARRFLESFAAAQERNLSFAPETLDMLKSHAWPGNVRELKNAIEAATVFCNGEVVLPADLQLDESDLTPGGRRAGRGDGPEEGITDLDQPRPPSAMSLEENEREAILRALTHTGWNKTAAADLLGISRRAIHYKIKKYGIEVPGRSGPGM